MSDPRRILITGFGPFPGAPVNPTIRLVRTLATLRRPAFADVVRIPHIFDVTYAAVDRDLPALIARHRPDALLCFGLAARTPYIRIETRARNAVSMLWPDADGTPVRRGFITAGADAQMFAPHTAQLYHAVRRTGADVRLSRDAGRYLCNYLSWRIIEAGCREGGPRLVSFVHVPLDTRGLLDAGEALLRETIRLAR